MVQDLKEKKKKSVEFSLLFLNLSVPLPPILCVLATCRFEVALTTEVFFTNHTIFLTF